MDRRARGQAAEQRALQFLSAHGAQLLDRNYRSRRGEIDLVVRDGDCLVFVEVRLRTSPATGTAAESIGHDKQARLVACAEHYLQANPDAARSPCRFDVIAFDGDDAEPEWIKNAFTAA